jgi:hypothetical protein
VTEVPIAVDLLRKQVADILAQIDRAALTLPAPDKLNSRRHEHPGATWTPDKHWEIFTVDTPDNAGFVFVDHRCDDLDYPWGQRGDWEALRAEDARRIGLAYLAAAKRAEEQATGVARLDAFRRSEEDDKESSGAAPVRRLKPRGTR